MSRYVLSLQAIQKQDQAVVGGKAFALAELTHWNFRVPDALCVSTRAYQRFVQSNGLAQRIALEMGRKVFADLRWEEIWDISLRIRNLFASLSLPKDLEEDLSCSMAETFQDRAVSVRSSAPGEDSSLTSFAGLHESFVNISGVPEILQRIKLVWASLWSDRSLMYRKEIGLDPGQSTMAVLVQEMAIGECSGITFGKNPNDYSQAVIESVHGLNQGLVDGTVEPDRWLVDRKSARILAHHPASQRQRIMLPFPEGVRLADCPQERQDQPPLTEEKVSLVFDLVLKAEQAFGQSQDMEWTFQGENLLLLQSRPITTIKQQDEQDQRSWYLSLQRSFENLQSLRRRIETELIPAMEQEVANRAGMDLRDLDDEALAREIDHRRLAYAQWKGVYWADFIPMAHGMRLFGQIYNDRVQPTDPYEFMRLLGDDRLISLKRNQMLGNLAATIRSDDALAEAIREHRSLQNEAFQQGLETFEAEFGDLTCAAGQCAQGRGALLAFLLEIASHQPQSEPVDRLERGSLEDVFFNSFTLEQQGFAEELLELGRVSYRLRDDDNIHLGRIEHQLQLSLEEARERHAQTSGDSGPLQKALAQAESVLASDSKARTSEGEAQDQATVSITLRQIVGQPAGPGLARGPARVIRSDADLMAFKGGEILVCDAVEPNMTFVVPLAAGIVERRGGMLIHGAIIAREYGLACVTGIPRATSCIRTGDQLTVDGYLGLVIVHSASAERYS